MPKRTNPFQQLAASIMAVLHAPDYLVEESILEITPETGLPREIDILIIEVNNTTNKIMVECRDWKRKQDVIWIDQLDGKARSLGIKRVIAVSSSGFHKTTLGEADSRGIETMHLREAEEGDWKNWLFGRLNEFGINIDFEPIVKSVNFISPTGIIPPNLKDIKHDRIFLFNSNTKKRIPLDVYLKGLIKDPKIIEYVRMNNSDEAISHYDYKIPCDKGVGYTIDGKDFFPLIEVVFKIDSVRRSYKVPLEHLRAGDKKILTGPIDDNSKLFLEERDGSLAVLIESKTQKP